MFREASLKLKWENSLTVISSSLRNFAMGSVSLEIFIISFLCFFFLGTFEISLRALWWPLVKEIREAYLIYLLDWFLTASSSSKTWLAFKCSSSALKSLDNLSTKIKFRLLVTNKLNLNWVHFPVNAKNY